MRDNSVLKVYETKAEWEHIKEEEIQKQDHELKNEITFKNLTETVNEVQSKFDVLEQTITALSNRVSNDDDQFSELNEILRKLDETLNKDNTILSQHNEILTGQNETTQVLNTDENNLGGIDGMDEDSFLMLENNGQNWKQLNIKLPYGITDHGAQFLNDNLYIFGGEYEYEALNSTYNLSKTLKWEKMADMNQKRSGISNSNVILNNQIWVCGGWDKPFYSLKSVEMYDLETNTWKYMKEMNECRESAAAAVVNGKIFCSGGSNAKILNSIECYDPSSDVWTLICNMPQYIDGHSAVEIDGHFIIIGGFGGGNSVWALDTTNENAIWIEKPSMLMSNLYFSIAKIHHQIFVCGGVSENNVEIFDGQVWRNGPKMPTNRWLSPAVVIPIEFARELEQFIANPLESSEYSEE